MEGGGSGQGGARTGACTDLPSDWAIVMAMSLTYGSGPGLSRGLTHQFGADGGRHASVRRGMGWAWVDMAETLRIAGRLGTMSPIPLSTTRPPTRPRGGPWRPFAAIPRPFPSCPSPAILPPQAMPRGHTGVV